MKWVGYSPKYIVVSKCFGLSHEDAQDKDECCCCDSPAALLLSSVVQIEEVCDCGRVVP